MNENQINGNGYNGNVQQMAGTTTPPAQPGKFKKMMNAASRKWTMFRYSKVGRILSGVTKAAIIGGAAYAGYKEGQKSVKPSVVYVQPEKLEEPATTETPTTTEEPVEEKHDEV